MDTQLCAVAEALRERGPFGATDNELENLLQGTHQTVSARRRELVIAGFVEESGETRRTDSGGTANVWRWVPKTPVEGEVLHSAVREALRARKPKRRAQGKLAPLNLIGMVRASRQRHGRGDTPETPTPPPKTVVSMAFHNLEGDLLEARRLIERGDVEAATKRLARITYTAIGLSMECGTDIGEAFNGLHRYYMSTAPKSQGSDS